MCKKTCDKTDSDDPDHVNRMERRSLLAEAIKQEKQDLEHANQTHKKWTFAHEDHSDASKFSSSPAINRARLFDLES